MLASLIIHLKEKCYISDNIYRLQTTHPLNVKGTHKKYFL